MHKQFNSCQLTGSPVNPLKPFGPVEPASPLSENQISLLLSQNSWVTLIIMISVVAAQLKHILPKTDLPEHQIFSRNSSEITDSVSFAHLFGTCYLLSIQASSSWQSGYTLGTRKQIIL